MAAHAPLPPSQAYRWKNCPASQKACVGIERKASPYADEGTTCHWAFKMLLIPPEGAECHWVFKTPPIPPAEPTQAMICPDTGMEVTDEMLEHAQRFVEKVKTMALGKILKVEEPVQYNVQCHGTLDIAIWCPEILDVIDFKYGKGVKVKAEENDQLRIYALAAIKTFGLKPEIVRLSIYQPRCGDEENPMETEELPIEALRKWEKKVLVPALKATAADNPAYCSGDWCRWCPALGLCIVAHEECNTIQKVGTEVLLPDPKKLTMEQLAKAMQGVELLEEWIKALEGHAFNILSSGQAIPGHKLVRKRSNRQWTAEGQTEIQALLKEKAWHAPKLISPAQAEKLLPDKKMIEGLTEKPEGGLTVAEESDKREAVVPNPVAEHFTEGLALLE